MRYLDMDDLKLGAMMWDALVRQSNVKQTTMRPGGYVCFSRGDVEGGRSRRDRIDNASKIIDDIKDSSGASRRSYAPDPLYGGNFREPWTMIDLPQMPWPDNL